MAKLMGKRAIGRVSGASPLNFSPRMRRRMNLPDRVILNDCTLREGRQVEGTILSIDEYLRIARLLVEELNLSMIQTGYFAPGDYEYIRALGKLGLPAKVETMIASHQMPPYTKEAVREALDRIGECHLGVVICLALSNDILRATAVRRGQRDKSVDYLKKQELEVGIEAVEYAKRQKVSPVNVNLQDFLKADVDYTETFCRELERVGVDTIAFDDFAGGVGLPQLYKERFIIARGAAPKTSLAIHAHNNCGLAVASAIASFEGGCDMVDCGVNGYGEAAGHVDLAQTAVILEFLYGYDTGIRLEKLRETCVLIADIMRQPIPKTAPVVGDNAFAFLHDYHWMYPIHPEFPFLFKSLAPEVVGSRSRPAFGEWVGPSGIRVRAEGLGLELPLEKAAQMVGVIREEMKWRKRSPTDEEFRKLALAMGATPQRSRGRSAGKR